MDLLITSGLDAMSAHVTVRDPAEGIRVLRDVRVLVKGKRSFGTLGPGAC